MTALDPVNDSPQASHVDSTPAPKKLVVCLDGTNNQIGVSRATNVGKTFEMLSLTAPSKQVAYYDPGVGTLPASTAHGQLGRVASRGAELAFGWGLRTNLIQAYTWLMQHYQFRDEIYIFGFSRGAYTARALVGMLNQPGLLRPGSENLVDYAVREYTTARKLTESRRQGIQEFADTFCWGTGNDQLSPQWSTAEHHEQWHAVPIKYLGLWDTVKAAGFGPLWNLKWPLTHKLENVERIRHAVSIDEHRGPYKQDLIDEREGVEEVWFAGVHCDVGGTFPECKLATIALKWVLDGAVRDLILREADSYSRQCTPDLNPPPGEIHKMGWPWKLTGVHHRIIPDGARFHATVELRIRDDGYQPKLPATYSFVDQSDWMTLVPASELTVGPQR